MTSAATSTDRESPLQRFLRFEGGSGPYDGAEQRRVELADTMAQYYRAFHTTSGAKVVVIPLKPAQPDNHMNVAGSITSDCSSSDIECSSLDVECSSLDVECSSSDVECSTPDIASLDEVVNWILETDKLILVAKKLFGEFSLEAAAFLDDWTHVLEEIDVFASSLDVESAPPA